MSFLLARDANSLTNSDVFEAYFEKSTPEKLVFTDEFFVNILFSPFVNNPLNYIVI